jgi:hypothetical protein
MKVLQPLYGVKSADTYKRRILCMYAVLKVLMIGVFATVISKSSLTFDGWSTPMLKGFYVVTIHFIDSATGKLYETILDFFYAPGGTGLGTRTGQYLAKLVKVFRIENKVLCTLNDNGADAVKASQVFADTLEEEGCAVIPMDHLLRCFTHTSQIGWHFAF